MNIIDGSSLNNTVVAASIEYYIRYASVKTLFCFDYDTLFSATLIVCLQDES